jgi:glycerol-3-phosphate dehydrogenase (NAD(P)+)
VHAIILAAGLGSRLGGGLPKPLTPIDIRTGWTLLDNQLAILRSLLTPLQVTLVVGHGAARVRAAHPGLPLLANPRYAATNTAASLRLALDAIDDDVVWMNGDLYFETDAAAALLASPHDASRALVQLVAADAEQVKFSLHADGSIAGLSKSAADARGESLGMHLLLRRARLRRAGRLFRGGAGAMHARAYHPHDARGCQPLLLPRGRFPPRSRRGAPSHRGAAAMSRPLRVGMFGTGHFGYALLRHLEPKALGHDRTLPIDLRAYDRDEVVRRSLAEQRRHPFDHDGSPLGQEVLVAESVDELLHDLDVLILAVTSVSTRDVAQAIASTRWTGPLTIVNTAKALDDRTGRRLSQIITDIIDRPSQPMTYAALSGGTIADELLRQNPLGITIAAATRPARRQLHRLFTSPRMWVQVSSDVVGVELAGAFKNVISICAGLMRGLDLSYGAETHLISRMAHEVETFCVRTQGARRATFAIGSQCWGSDLWMSCTGPTRNRALGELIGQGRTLEQAHQLMRQQHKTVEGVATLRSLGALLAQHPDELPLLRIADQVILHGVNPMRLIEALMEG